MYSDYFKIGGDELRLCYKSMQYYQNDLKRSDVVFNQNDPVAKMGEMLAMLFAVMADTVIKRCGEEKGTEIVKDAVFRFGYERGVGIRNKVLLSNEEITFENFEKYHDIPDNNGWDCESTHSDTRLWEYTRYCPYSNKWKQMGLESVGKHYCEVDRSIMLGYFGDVEFERLQLFDSSKDGHCEMIVQIR